MKTSPRIKKNHLLDAYKCLAGLGWHVGCTGNFVGTATDNSTSKLIHESAALGGFQAKFSLYSLMFAASSSTDARTASRSPRREP
jgi:hypothetical protein